MKLDVSALAYLSRDELRVLTAVEMGMKNHEVVPGPLVASIAGLRHGGAGKLLTSLLRHKLLHHESVPFDGFRLTYLGYDFLALKTLLRRGKVFGVGRQIGVGKESDIFVVLGPLGKQFAEDGTELEKKEDEEGEGEEGGEKETRELCLKLHRLGRTSFRAVKNKRDYHKGRKSPSYFYMSRLAATKEFEFMKALYLNGFPVPEPIGANRHAVIMSLVNGSTLQQVSKLDRPEILYSRMMDLIVRLGKAGLVHGDFNEFNVMVSDTGEITLIDFPQMVSMSHPNARMYFERDVNCVRRFFRKRFGLLMENFPDFETVRSQRESSLDVLIAASGFSKTVTADADRLLLEHHDQSHKEENANSDDEEEEGEDGEKEEEEQGEKNDNDEEDDSAEEEEEEEEGGKSGAAAYVDDSARVSWAHDYIDPRDREAAVHSSAGKRVGISAAKKAEFAAAAAKMNDKEVNLKVKSEIKRRQRRLTHGNGTRNSIKDRERRIAKQEIKHDMNDM